MQKKSTKKGRRRKSPNHTNRVPFFGLKQKGDIVNRKEIQGSLTVEAALVLPIFLFAALSILYINQLLRYEEEVQWALTRTAREASVEYAVSDKKITVNPAYLAVKMNRYVDDDLSVSMWKSRFDETTDTMKLVAEFSSSVPFPIINSRTFHFTECITTRAFTGVKTRLEEGEQEADTTVYVTKSGKVYHRKLSCTYLTLHISQVKFQDLEYLRSESGGIYYACDSCCRGVVSGAGEDVFICNYGDRYHRYRTCSKIKRSIQEIKLSEAGSRLPCSKCGKES